VLLRLGFTDFEIVINHRQALTAVLTGAGVAAERHGEALIAFDKTDKIGLDGVNKELESRGFDAQTRGNLVAAMGASYGADRNEPGFENLREIIRLARATSAGPYIRIEPTLARGLSYYTGAIFEIKVKDLAGSLGGGGRYDDLVGMFSGEKLPACGFSLGLERILVVMGERNMFPPSLAATPADVMVVQWFAGKTDLYLQFATELRAAGVRVELYPDAPDADGKKVGDKQFKYASARGIPFVAVIGGDELANGTVAIKNMKTGEQKSVARADVVKWLNS
jgi:histidyl-tRNA synthetase